MPNSAPDSLAPRNCKPPLEPLEEEEDAEEPAAEAELVALPTALDVAEVVVAAAAAATEDVKAAEEEEEGAVGAASELDGMAAAELLVVALLLQSLRWTPGAARAQAARPAASMEVETRITNECGGLVVEKKNEKLKE